MCTPSVSNVIYHKFSHGAAFCTLNGKNVNVMLEFTILNLTCLSDTFYTCLQDLEDLRSPESDINILERNENSNMNDIAFLTLSTEISLLGRLMDSYGKGVATAYTQIRRCYLKFCLTDKISISTCVFEFRNSIIVTLARF